MQDTHTLVTYDQEDKNQASTALLKELNAAVT
jgi:hypothetical protein